MTKGSLTSRQDCEDLVRGCTFYGTGGGGNPKQGLKRLYETLEEGTEVGWVDITEIPDDAWTCTAFMMGSIAPMAPEKLREMERFGLPGNTYVASVGEAIKELGEYAGVDISALVAVELGGSNTAEPLIFGAQLGIPVVDGDYAGRAVPEEAQCTPYIYGKDSFPQVSVDQWGNVIIIKKACNPFMLERIGKYISVAAFVGVSLAGTLLEGREMKEALVEGTISKSLGLGRRIREARERGDDPVKAAIEYTKGWLLFEGEVTEKEWEDRDGYMFGTTHIKGSGEFDGKKMDVWFENENLVSWMDGEPFVCSPDLIVVVDRATGEGFTNTDLDAGHQVAVLGIKGLEVYRSERGLAAAGPRYFGFDIDYVPIEEIMS